MLIDSHCHLDYLEREGDDLGAVVERARAEGVSGMLTIGTKLSQAAAVIGIAERFDRVWCSVGVHPHEAEAEGPAAPDRLVALAGHEKVVAIGETGLDFYYDNSPRDAQRASFRQHIEAARRSGLPLVVHSRDADAETVEILRDEQGRGRRVGGVIHCFSGGPALATGALDLGFYISLAGILTFKKAEELRQIAAGVPLDRLLVETDSPYLAPIPHRGKRNEPAFVVHTAAMLAKVKGIGAAEVAAATTENFFRLFERAGSTAPPA